MNPRVLVVSLLFAAICLSFLSVPNANSQSSAATTTMTLTQPPPGQCAVRSFAFSEVKGVEITGTYGSDAQVNFYILTQDDYNSIQNCRLPTTATPLFVETNAVGHGNRYRTLPFPANATYYFVFIYVSGPAILASGYATVELSFPASIIMTGNPTGSSTAAITSGSSTAATTTSSSSSSSTTASTIVLPTSVASGSSSMSSMTPQASQASQTSQAGSLVAFGNFGTVGAIAVVVVIAMVGSVMLLTRRKKTSKENVVAVTLEKPPQKAEPVEQAPQPPAGEALSTGYGDLDSLLVGGLPKGFAVLLLSPPCDERDLLLRKIIGSALSTGMATFYLSNDPSRIQDMVNTYWKDFFALSPQADKIVSPPANLYKIPGIDNLSDLNIALTKTIETRVKPGTGNRLLIVDLLTDILLHHKALTARKWLSDFIARRKAEGFTVLAFLNPLVASDEETQTLIDVFDGVIEIYEKELRERSRRFLLIKRMYGHRYSESELMLDKDKLF